MKLPLVLAFLATAIVGIGFFVTQHQPQESARGSTDTTLRLEQLAQQLTEMRSEIEALREQRSPAADRLANPSIRTPELSDEALDAAVERWMAANAPTEASAPGKPEIEELANMSTPELLELVRDEDLSDDQRQLLWQRFAKAGRVDEVLAAFEELAAESPFDPDLQVELGSAYLYKIFDVGQGPLAGEYAMKADAAFERALELDDQHLEARFIKAVSLSNWPAFLGKTPQAIGELEELLTIQAEMPVDSQSASAFLILGNLYLQTGERDKALSTWRNGLGVFPNSSDLQQQIAANE